MLHVGTRSIWPKSLCHKRKGEYFSYSYIYSELLLLHNAFFSTIFVVVEISEIKDLRLWPLKSLIT